MPRRAARWALRLNYFMRPLSRKPWSDDIDEWTHWLHGPGSNPVAADKRVGISRRLLWTATPRRSRSHEKSPSLTGMVSARGRLFYICDEAPVSVGGKVPDRWRLVARGALSGALLWKCDLHGRVELDESRAYTTPRGQACCQNH